MTWPAVTFPTLIMFVAVEEVAALVELVEVVLIEAFEEEDMIELDNGLLLVLEVVTWRILRPAFDHVEAAQSLDARTDVMGTRSIAREISFSDGVIL